VPGPASVAEAIDAETRGAIKALCVELAWLIDHDRSEQVPALFTPDGRYESPRGVMAGAAALRAGWSDPARRGGAVGRHVLSNFRLRPAGADAVAGEVLFVHHAIATGVTTLGEYHDLYRRSAQDGAWRIAHRRLVLVSA